mgnify:FL=1
MDLINLDGKYFLYKKIGNVNLVTTTANSDFGFNPKLKTYEGYVDFVKNKFGFEKLFTVSQVHGNVVRKCDSNFLSGVVGDGLITNQKNFALGVFTADCVPIFLFDRSNEVVSILHSGWRGTYDEIIANSIDIFISDYGSKLDDIEIFVGAHNKVCCYEVGVDLINKFLEKDAFKNNFNIYSKNNLNLFECIKTSALNKGISELNISSCNYCTYCSEEVKFYSYRKDTTSLNRILSFIFM